VQQFFKAGSMQKGNLPRKPITMAGSIEHIRQVFLQSCRHPCNGKGRNCRFRGALYVMICTSALYFLGINCGSCNRLNLQIIKKMQTSKHISCSVLKNVAHLSHILFTGNATFQVYWPSRLAALGVQKTGITSMSTPMIVQSWMCVVWKNATKPFFQFSLQRTQLTMLLTWTCY
jgi:hypothetical protein